MARHANFQAMGAEKREEKKSRNWNIAKLFRASTRYCFVYSWITEQVLYTVIIAWAAKQRLLVLVIVYY